MNTPLQPNDSVRTAQASSVLGTSERGRWENFERVLPEEERLLRRALATSPCTSRILEVGTGNGRLLLHLAEEGFTRLTGIDLSERLLERAREKAAARQHAITYELQDAAELRLADGAFDVVIALQQLLSIVGTAERRARTIRHFYRVLAPGGLLVASGLDWHGRGFNNLLGLAIAPLKLLKGERATLSPHYLPLLKPGGRWNLRYAWEAQPYSYWFRRAEFDELVTGAGFEVVERTTSRELRNGSGEPAHGEMLYVIARKPEVPNHVR